MKIELDFDQKIITVVSEVNMKELYDKIKELKLDPKEWKLQHNMMTFTTTPQIYPIISFPAITQPEPYKSPSWGDFTTITCGTNQIPSIDLDKISYNPADLD